MKAIQLESQVGDDGVLSLHVPLGTAEARSRVIVTIATFSTQKPSAGQEFTSRTYGSCAGFGLEEPEDLPLPRGDS